MVKEYSPKNVVVFVNGNPLNGFESGYATLDKNESKESESKKDMDKEKSV